MGVEITQINMAMMIHVSTRFNRTWRAPRKTLCGLIRLTKIYCHAAAVVLNIVRWATYGATANAGALHTFL
jgi:hypothetical protein